KTTLLLFGWSKSTEMGPSKRRNRPSVRGKPTPSIANPIDVPAGSMRQASVAKAGTGGAAGEERQKSACPPYGFQELDARREGLRGGHPARERSGARDYSLPVFTKPRGSCRWAPVRKMPEPSALQLDHEIEHAARQSAIRRLHQHLRRRDPPLLEHRTQLREGFEAL